MASAALQVVGSVIGGRQASKGAQAAADTSAAASNYATDVQRQMRDEEVARQKPFYDMGVSKLAQLGAGTADGGEFMRPFTMADYQADPGYAFRRSEGMRDIEQSAAARGGAMSGNTLRALQQYGQGLASQEYGNAYDRYQAQQANRFNRLASLAGYGQTAAGTLGQSGGAYASNLGNIAMGNAANQGNAALVSGQLRSSTLQGIGQALGGVDWSKMNWGGGSSIPNSPTTSLGSGFQQPGYHPWRS